MTLQDFFRENSKIALAFSGGVDSAYLLYAAKKYGATIHAYYVKSAFQPQFELQDAKRLVNDLGAEMTVLSVDVLSETKITENPKDRCYYCKKQLFSAIAKVAADDGFSLLIDGTNASDDASDRPGMRVLKELSVRSPLKECGLKKEDIRQRSKESGLFTWDKPAYACLATRICTGEKITKAKLEKTEKAEDFLFSMGLKDFRVRIAGNNAKLQVTKSQIPLVIDKREEIVKELKKHYDEVVLDLEVRR